MLFSLCHVFHSRVWHCSRGNTRVFVVITEFHFPNSQNSDIATLGRNAWWSCYRFKSQENAQHDSHTVLKISRSPWDLHTTQQTPCGTDSSIWPIGNQMMGGWSDCSRIAKANRCQGNGYVCHAGIRIGTGSGLFQGTNTGSICGWGVNWLCYHFWTNAVSCSSYQTNPWLICFRIELWDKVHRLGKSPHLSDTQAVEQEREALTSHMVTLMHLGFRAELGPVHHYLWDDTHTCKQLLTGWILPQPWQWQQCSVVVIISSCTWRSHHILGCTPCYSWIYTLPMLNFTVVSFKKTSGSPCSNWELNLIEPYRTSSMQFCSVLKSVQEKF